MDRLKKYILSKRLVQNFHGHHDLSLATLHVHLDDDSCMEVTALRGATGDVQHFADHIIAERGVRYGRVVMIPTSAKRLRSAPRRGRGGGQCEELRRACENKDRLGEQGEGNCRRYRETCQRPVRRDVCGELRQACLNKDLLGEQGEGNCRRYRQTCRGRI
jgi:hypothetical protein